LYFELCRDVFLRANSKEQSTKLKAPSSKHQAQSTKLKAQSTKYKAQSTKERRCRRMALNGRVLLLNQTYEPLGTVSVARAVIMAFKNSVTVEELDGDRVLRSANAEFPFLL